jgi:hypothetical protein
MADLEVFRVAESNDSQTQGYGAQRFRRWSDAREGAKGSARDRRLGKRVGWFSERDVWCHIAVSLERLTYKRGR